MLPERHAPPAIASVNAVADPLHTVAVPVIAAGAGSMVSAAVAAQPLPKV
jgi:hypothetical protein